MRKICLAILLVTFFVSCEEKQEKPKVIYDAEKTDRKPAKPDSSQIKIADLPIHMEGTKYLIHAIGDVRIYEGGSRGYGSSNTNSVSYAISNYNRFELTGYFENLKFQHIDSTNLKPLTDKNVQIQTVTFLNTLTTLKKQILVYSLVDSDTNRDAKLDANDIKSLYLSEINGENFQKISADLQELIDWNVVEAKNRLYFRAIEDINKNGAFDKNDKVHYFFVDLSASDWEAQEYNPIEG
ncbi:hypothetical protein GV828_06735 [Flavobacterium sp. NST-5]|uniref:Lipoprotein n=1 Tax=Flavobacterium ichthyis TaxID=2698827 RepID=A0ABW9ZAV2_9FLAO|nr:hypothetical protein [Flavobacterium ichthyis]NBL64894.1 hypothetical protein [Flavobacterium ichthyis]